MAFFAYRKHYLMVSFILVKFTRHSLSDNFLTALWIEHIYLGSKIYIQFWTYIKTQSVFTVKATETCPSSIHIKSYDLISHKIIPTLFLFTVMYYFYNLFVCNTFKF